MSGKKKSGRAAPSASAPAKMPPAKRKAAEEAEVARPKRSRAAVVQQQLLAAAPVKPSRERIPQKVAQEGRRLELGRLRTDVLWA
jgi:hypothetical protein